MDTERGIAEDSSASDEVRWRKGMGCHAAAGRVEPSLLSASRP